MLLHAISFSLTDEKQRCDRQSSTDRDSPNVDVIEIRSYPTRHQAARVSPCCARNADTINTISYSHLRAVMQLKVQTALCKNFVSVNEDSLACYSMKPPNMAVFIGN